MTPEGGRALDVTADLTLEVDGTPVQIRADGSELAVSAADVRQLLSAVRLVAGAATVGPPGRAELARVAEGLAGHGLTARLDGPAGRVLSLGAEVDSPVGSAVLGTRRARLHPLGALRAVGPAVPVALAAALLLTAAVVRRSRR